MVRQNIYALGVGQNNAPVDFSELSTSDLQLHRSYCGGDQPNVGADPLHKLMGVGNSGGFRYINATRSARPALCVLFSTGTVPEWPDGFESEDTYVYFGDQRKPNKDIHDTALNGNRLLADVAAQLRRTNPDRSVVPPFFLFEKAGRGRDVRFEGLLVPSSGDWLSVERRSHKLGDVVNYRARFSRLDVRTVSRRWLAELRQGMSTGSAAPEGWKLWITTEAQT